MVQLSRKLLAFAFLFVILLAARQSPSEERGAGRACLMHSVGRCGDGGQMLNVSLLVVLSALSPASTIAAAWLSRCSSFAVSRPGR